MSDKQYLSRHKQAVLVRAAQRGDEEAWNKLVSAFQEALLGFIGSRVRSYHDAQDVAQKTWLDIKKKIHTCDVPEVTFYTFIRGFAVNRIKDELRRKGQREAREIPFEDFPHVAGEPGLAEIGVTESDDACGLISAEQEEELCTAYAILLNLVFSRGGYPHQLICFGFNKLLKMWGPKRIVAELSDRFLEELAVILVSEYGKESNLPGEELRRSFAPLFGSMNRLVREALLDDASKRKLQGMLDMPVGRTTLADYYGKDSEHSVSDWCNKVELRIKRIAAGEPEIKEVLEITR